MLYTHLGRSGLSVSQLCLGTMNFGPHTEEAATLAVAQEFTVTVRNRAGQYMFISPASAHQ